MRYGAKRDGPAARARRRRWEAFRVAAERQFEQHGPEGVSVRSIADEVGTTTRAVHALFGSKDGLMLDALAQRAYET